jgi:hypothetical protein
VRLLQAAIAVDMQSLRSIDSLRVTTALSRSTQKILVSCKLFRQVKTFSSVDPETDKNCCYNIRDHSARRFPIDREVVDT